MTRSLILILLIVFSFAEALADQADSYYCISCMGDVSYMLLNTEVNIYSEFARAASNKTLAKKYNLYPLDDVKRSHTCHFKSGQTYIVNYNGDRFFSVSTADRKILEFFSPGFLSNRSTSQDESLRLDRVMFYVDLVTACGLVREETSRCESFHYDDYSIKFGYSKVPADHSKPIDLKLLFSPKIDGAKGSSLCLAHIRAGRIGSNCYS
jgi:hypothetical protein